jgi:uncharacterized protein
VAVRVLREQPDGRRSVVSHHAKHTRGLVARHLLRTGADPRSVHELREVLAEAFGADKPVAGRPGRPWTLDVVEP